MSRKPASEGPYSSGPVKQAPHDAPVPVPSGLRPSLPMSTEPLARQDVGTKPKSATESAGFRADTPVAPLSPRPLGLVDPQGHHEHEGEGHGDQHDAPRPGRDSLITTRAPSSREVRHAA